MGIFCVDNGGGEKKFACNLDASLISLLHVYHVSLIWRQSIYWMRSSGSVF